MEQRTETTQAVVNLKNANQKFKAAAPEVYYFSKKRYTIRNAHARSIKLCSCNFVFL